MGTRPAQFGTRWSRSIEFLRRFSGSNWWYAGFGRMIRIFPTTSAISGTRFVSCRGRHHVAYQTGKSWENAYQCSLVFANSRCSGISLEGTFASCALESKQVFKIPLKTAYITKAMRLNTQDRRRIHKFPFLFGTSFHNYITVVAVYFTLTQRPRETKTASREARNCTWIGRALSSWYRVGSNLMDTFACTQNASLSSAKQVSG